MRLACEPVERLPAHETGEAAHETGVQERAQHAGSDLEPQCFGGLGWSQSLVGPFSPWPFAVWGLVSHKP